MSPQCIRLNPKTQKWGPGPPGLPVPCWLVPLSCAPWRPGASKWHCWTLGAPACALALPTPALPPSRSTSGVTPPNKLHINLDTPTLLLKYHLPTPPLGFTHQGAEDQNFLWHPGINAFLQPTEAPSLVPQVSPPIWRRSLILALHASLLVQS
jgi:hypothetical protein